MSSRSSGLRFALIFHAPTDEQELIPTEGAGAHPYGVDLTGIGIAGNLVPGSRNC